MSLLVLILDSLNVDVASDITQVFGRLYCVKIMLELKFLSADSGAHTVTLMPLAAGIPPDMLQSSFRNELSTRICSNLRPSGAIYSTKSPRPT